MSVRRTRASPSARPLPPPRSFLASIQTYAGVDPCALRHKTLTKNGATVFVEEEQSAGDEVGHGNERVGYLAIEPGLLAPLRTFANWIAGFDVGNSSDFDDDFDGDGLPNGIESFLGTAPDRWNAGFSQVTFDGAGFQLQHPQNAASASDVTGSYQWSSDLADWYFSGDSVGDTTVTITPLVDTPVQGTTTVTISSSGAGTLTLFIRLVATQAP